MMTIDQLTISRFDSQEFKFWVSAGTLKYKFKSLTEGRCGFPIKKYSL